MTITADRIAQGDVRPNFVLEFRVWIGASYAWVDYTSRLIEFNQVGSQVEQGAFPNAFRMTIGDIVVDNSDHMFDNLDVLDGMLYNASEPYGKSIYKRMVRIREWDSGAFVFTGLVRDVILDSQTPRAVLKVISLDARAADQKADADKAERHPVGGTAKTSPANWTLTVPPSATDTVAMYRWREEESQQQVSYGWFKNRHFCDIVERTAWALDDLGYDITRNYRFMTSPNREIATNRDVPPNDGSISIGATPNRTRTVVWNTYRQKLLCCVGNRLYDYDPTTGVYTYCNLLTSGLQVVRGWYLNVADSGGYSNRIVLLAYDADTYETSSARVTAARLTVLNAEGSGAYSVLADVSIGSEFFPGTHFFREGAVYGSDRIAGQSYFGFVEVNRGENIFNPFRQRLDITSGSYGTEALNHQQWDETKSTILALGASPTGYAEPQTLGRGYSCAKATASVAEMGYKYSYGQFPIASVNIGLTGGRFYFVVWDSSNKYRLAMYNLYNYTGLTYYPLPNATYVPHFMHSSLHATLYPERLYVNMIELIDTGTANSLDRMYYWNVITSAWTAQNWLAGASGDNVYWTAMEVMHRMGSNDVMALLFNRKTQKWRFTTNIMTNWAGVDAACQNMYGKKDQDNRLEGLTEAVLGTGLDRAYFVEAGANMLWRWDDNGGGLAQMNKSPSTAAFGDRINTDRGLGAYPVHTGGNYPDSNTPNGVLFGISANDYPYAGSDQPSGEYTLWQFANFDAGYVPLLDVSGLTLWDLRTLLAEKYGYVHYYNGQGSVVFKPRVTSGAAEFTFSESNHNLNAARIDSRGFEAILNDILVYPYSIVSEQRSVDPVKGYNDPGTNGAFAGPEIVGQPGESSQWLMLFTTMTEFSLYKLQGSGASPTTPLYMDRSINTEYRALGGYLSILPGHFTGSFAIGDTFTFWVLEPQEKLEKGGDADIVRVIDQTSIDRDRRIQKEFDNRFIGRQTAGDFANNILAWRKDRHDVVAITAAFDADYAPLKRCVLQDSGMGLDGATFQIMGVRHDSKKFQSELTLVKV